MPVIVISAVNIVEGGMLKILQDCLLAVRNSLPEWRIIAIVNNESVCDTPGVEKIVMPDAKKSWIRRIYTEYITFRKISKRIDADIWWSLHDMTPYVKAGSQFVYCHNASPFYRFSPSDLLTEPKLIMFKALYSIFYRINIKANRAVVVQQDWLRQEFERRYHVDNVVVAHPVEAQTCHKPLNESKVTNFVYPSLARVFKNFELIGEAAMLLESQDDWNGRILWTIAPDENKLTRDLYRRYGHIRSLSFIGRQDRAAMTQRYREMNCLLFPSRLETWGLPISETKSMGKPMIVADLPYAHETVGTYDRVIFVDPSSPRQLADAMLQAHRAGWSFSPVQAAPIAAPFADSWPRLVETIVALHEARSDASLPQLQSRASVRP